jgi:hypothetical protein
MSPLCLGLTLLWCEEYHGNTTDSTDLIETHWIFQDEVSLDEFYNPYWLLNFSRHISLFVDDNKDKLSIPVLRTYASMINNPIIDIVQVIELKGQEMVVIIKTMWIRILQRKWKKYFNNIRNIL